MQMETHFQLLLSIQPLSNRRDLGGPIRFSASNQVLLGKEILTDEQGEEIAKYLHEIVKHFRKLYDMDLNFAMEVEFKITKEDQLVIKQARPWVN